MSGSSTARAPSPAYLEDVNEDSQIPIPGSKQTANTAAKRSREAKKSKRDEASDSGYSSRTVATTGSSSLGSKDGSTSKNILKRISRKMPGSSKKLQTKEESSPPKAEAKKPISRVPKKENLREDAAPQDRKEETSKTKFAGAIAKPKKSNAVHQHLPEKGASKSPTKPAAATQQATKPIPIPNTAPAARVRTSSNEARSAQRPPSYHGSVPIQTPYVYATPQVPLHRPPLAQLSIPGGWYAPPYPSPATTMIPTPLPTSPTRYVEYPFAPTVPHYYSPAQYSPEGYYRQPPPASRRSSMYAGMPGFERPTVPPTHHAFQRANLDYTLRRQSAASIDHHTIRPYPMDGGAIFTEDTEEDYYRQPTARRPRMPHSATTSATIPKRPDQSSMGNTPRSPRKQSFEEPRSGSHPPTSNRTPSMKNTGLPVEAPMPPAATRRRLPRPVSYHGGSDAVKRAEEYQEIRKGQVKQVPLTTDTMKRVSTGGSLKRVFKTKSKGGSETASRASSSREGSKAEKSRNLFRVTMSDGTSIDVKGDSNDSYTIKTRHGQYRDGSMELNIGGAERTKYRDGRPKEREGDSLRDRRLSPSRRRGIKTIKERGESVGGSYRRSSSRPVTSRTSRGDSYEEHDETLRKLRAEAAVRKQDLPIEDEEEGDKTNGTEKGPLDSLRRLRTDSRSRKSSQSAVGRRSMAQGRMASDMAVEGGFF